MRALATPNWAPEKGPVLGKGLGAAAVVGGVAGGVVVVVEAGAAVVLGVGALVVVVVADPLVVVGAVVETGAGVAPGAVVPPEVVLGVGTMSARVLPGLVGGPPRKGRSSQATPGTPASSRRSGSPGWESK